MSGTAISTGVATPAAHLAANPPELRGNRLRIVVKRKVFGNPPESGSTWLYLSPSGNRDANDFEAWGPLPFEQAEALAEAAAAFNVIMDRHEAEATIPAKRRA